MKKDEITMLLHVKMNKNVEKRRRMSYNIYDAMARMSGWFCIFLGLCSTKYVAILRY